MSGLIQKTGANLENRAPEYPPKALFEPPVGFDLRLHSWELRLLRRIVIAKTGMAFVNYVRAAFPKISGASPSAYESQKQAYCSNGICGHVELLIFTIVSASTLDAMRPRFSFFQGAT